MAKKLRIDAYICNNCGFKFLGSTDEAINRRLADTKRSRLVLCPKCSGSCRIDKYATVRTMLFYLVVGTVTAVIVLWLMKRFEWI